MRFSVVVRDRSAGTEAVVLVDADPDATVAALLPALLGAVGSAIHPGFASKVPVWVDGRPVQPEDTARESGLAAGSVVCLHENDATPSTLPTGIVEVRVVSGPGAGRIHRARLGETVIGCGANGLSLPDPLLPADALTLTVARDGTATVQPADGIAATLDGTDLEGATQWPPGTTLSAGQTLLTLEAPWQPDALTVAADGRLGRDVNRPPRLLPAPWIREFTLPHKPEKPTRMGIPWLMVLSPMLMAVPMVWLMGSWRFAAFALLSPIMAIFNLIQGRRSGAADYKRKLAAYESTLVKVRERAAEALARERTERRAALPDPAQVLLQAVGPGARLWERRRTDPDYLVLRVGTATRASQVRVEDPNVDRNAEDVAPATVADVPVPVALRDFGVLGVTGAADQVDATARWLIGQAAVLHSPRDLRLVVLTDQRGEDRLGWVRWLPHTRTDDETLPAFVGNEQQSIGARVGELTRLVTDRVAAAEEGFGAGAKEMTGPDYLVVLDGARLLRALPGVVTILRQGPAVGVRVICLDPDRRSLPEECRVVLECSDDESLVTATGVADVPEVRLDLVETAWAARVAQALAPLRDITPSLEDAGLPRSARLLECVGLTDPTPDAVVAGWGQPQTDVVIGAGFDGMFRIDLRRDGPHALVAGTTGSGKSELLQTIVASLALANRPDQLTFVLVDYKGGSAFKECNKLPHTVGMVTDLDTHLVGRALTSLGAELRRREHLLSVPGAKDLEDYWALCRTDPTLPTIPRLVLVIDEFASLKAELPDFVTGLVTIAQRGRSLGIHLILATQRPSGVVSADIRANTNLRIALRVTDESESRDVIDAPEAGRILASTPGRGYARLGPSGVLPFQAGRVGGRRPDAPSETRTIPTPLAWGIPWSRTGIPAPGRPTTAASDTDEGETDLSVLVTAVRGAVDHLGMPPQHSPWLPALPGFVTLDELRARLVERDPAAAADPFTVGWALEDRPEDQAQVPATFTLGTSGHLFLVGGPRSGRSTALRTLVGALAEKVAARDLHVYGLDCGNGALLPLTVLAHTGAVVRRTEVERASRLIRRLTEEVARRQSVLGAHGFADIQELRSAAAPDDRLPYVLLVLDRWEGFMSDLADVDVGSLLDGMVTLLREGASVGIQVVVTGDRTLNSARVASLVEAKLALRLPDRQDYASLGLKVRDLPEEFPEGRGVWGERSIEAQIAVLGADASGQGQGTSLRELAAATAERDRDLPRALRPMALGALPDQVAWADVAADFDPGARPPSWLPFGIGGDLVEPIGLDLDRSPVALVAGESRTGKTATLCFLAAYARRSGRAVLGFVPRDNDLSADLGEGACIVGQEDPNAAVARLRDLPEGALVLVDDVEAYKDAPLTPLMNALVRQAADRGFTVVLSGRSADLGAGYSGWMFEARRGRHGLVLSPSEAIDGELFGSRVARTALRSRPHAGRGVLFDSTGAQTTVQVPLVERG